MVKVKITCSLKGKSFWAEGTILESPLPTDILSEIKRNTGTIEVIEKDVIIPVKSSVKNDIVLSVNKVTKTDVLKMKKEDLINFIGVNEKNISDKKRKELIKIAVGKI